MPGENRTIARRWVVLLALAGMASVAHAQPAPRPVSARFELNDAQVKGRALEGVAVSVSPAGGGGALSSGRTGADGRWTTPLPPGAYQVSYRLDGYVPYTSEATEVREDGQLVTVSLSRMLEATESGGREVRIILNWGSRPTRSGTPTRTSPAPVARGPATSTTGTGAHEAADHGRAGRGRHGLGRARDDHAHPPRARHLLYWVHDFSGAPRRPSGAPTRSSAS